MKQITIRKLGARLLGDSESTILQSMRQQNRLWNKLVEIERANSEAYRQIVTDSDAELAAITKEHQAVEEQLEEVDEERRSLLLIGAMVDLKKCESSKENRRKKKNGFQSCIVFFVCFYLFLFFFFFFHRLSN